MRTHYQLKGLAWILVSMIGAGGPVLAQTGNVPNPYQVIIQRNMFGLTPAPPTKPAETHMAPPLRKMALKGLTTILGYKQAMFTVEPRPGHHEQKKDYCLRQGGSANGIKVLAIDMQQEEVTLLDNGKQRILQMHAAKNDGSRQPDTPKTEPPITPPPIIIGPGHQFQFRHLQRRG